MVIKKNKDLKYYRTDLKKLSPEELIKLLIKETSHQDAMNIIRKEFQKFRNTEQVVSK